MELKVREISGIFYNSNRYCELIVESGSTTIESGTLSIPERRDLAEHLQDIVDDLLYELPEETKPPTL